jgi:predicted metal-dependent hydrolase
MQLDLPLGPPFDEAALPQSTPGVPASHPRNDHGASSRQSGSPDHRPVEPAGSSESPPQRTGERSDSVVFVRHPKARRYILRVRHDGSVRVTIPRGGSKREGALFARRQATWIERQRARLRRERLNGHVPPPAEVDPAAFERAKRELPVRLLELASEHGLRVARVSVRNQRGRWGSCSRTAHISLNWRLVEMPALVRDYVMIHELMHLKRMDHSPAYWALVDAACPHHRTARAWLRRYGRL